MRSRRLRICLALGSMAALMGAVVAVNSRLSYRPVSIDFAPGFVSTEPGYVPIEWGEGSLRLHWEPMSAAALGIIGAVPKWVAARTSRHKQLWQVARNWNRAPLPVFTASSWESANGVSLQLADDPNSTNSVRAQLWRGDILRSFEERGHRNSSNVMKPGPLSWLSLSPDGKRVALSSHLWGHGDHEEDLHGFCELGLVLFDAQSGRQIARQSAFEGIFSDVAWSPDSRQIAAIGVDGWVFVLDAQSGKLRLKFRAHQLFGACIAWAPDGRTLVTASNARMALSPTHLEYAFQSGAALSMGAGEGTITNGQIGDKDRFIVAQAPDGDATWNGKTERLLKRFDARSGTQLGAAIPLQTGAVDLAYSPDGTRIALGEHGFALILNAQTLSVVRRLDVPNPTIPGSIPAPVCVAWSQDGATLATSTSRGLTLWRVR